MTPLAGATAHSLAGTVAHGLAATGDPSQLLPARQQMAFTLGFHIILVPFGVALTTLMLVAHYRGLRKGDADAMLLARRWSKVAAVLFAVGAITGTVLSFELGILWPGLMGRYGAAVGFPFAIEGLFFFTEAIFVSIYIYGWKRLRPWPHFWTGVVVSLSSIGGAAAVIASNSWMNQPAGFTVHNGQVTSVSPGKVFFNGAFWYELFHMLLAAYIVAGFMVASVYAVGMLRGRVSRYHRTGFLTGFVVAAAATPLQIIMGDTIARYVFDSESAKFSAIELLPSTGTHVPETLGGVLIDGKVRYGLRIPDGASLLAGFSVNTRIKGLEAIPPQYRPTDREVSTVHLAFDVMVGLSFALLLLAVWCAWLLWRRHPIARQRWFLRASVLGGPAAVACLEAGWITTEVGRQPWIVVNNLLTRDAVATHGNLWALFAAVLAIYVAVGVTAVSVLLSMKRRWQAEGGDENVDVPYGPRSGLPGAAEGAGTP
ncbi:cytochrome ubiquinol oxidase subunit I [Actinacidiphila rubida]|uniref:cytochrome ubiquinol oxidase subunit I n=1 Tax=Actinacidiphila rubida TaxID=310780 RepID=UPI001FE9302F|nr:cytochrome ubiquinol oxidase subunit I [Actinacidiphila rubida]